MPEEGPRGCYDDVIEGMHVVNGLGEVGVVVAKITHVVYGRLEYLLKVRCGSGPACDTEHWTYTYNWEVFHGRM